MNRMRLVLLLAGFEALANVPAAGAQGLQAYLEGGRVHAAMPQTRFIAGRVLERLHNGAAVPFTVALTATVPGGGLISRVSHKVTLSYDLWEERYSAVRESPGRAASGLSAADAESWCVESVSLPASALAGQKTFVLKLEIHAGEEPPRAEGGPGLSVAGLVDVFSRKAREEPSHWSAASGILRLADLKEKNRKSSRQSFPAQKL